MSAPTLHPQGVGRDAKAAEAPSITLPDSLQLIADIIGVPGALKVAERWGGVRLYIPMVPDEDHDLAKLIGIESASRLCEAYAGERIEIPKADCWGRAIKHKLILAARANGESQAKVARAHGYTERHVRNIERMMEGDDKQDSLF